MSPKSRLPQPDYLPKLDSRTKTTSTPDSLSGNPSSNISGNPSSNISGNPSSNISGSPSARISANPSGSTSGNISARLKVLADTLTRCSITAEFSTEISQIITRWEQAIASQATSQATNQKIASTAGMIHAWCDGSCSPNPGPGGWGVVIQTGTKEYEFSGSSPESTNNMMEITAAIQALAQTPIACCIHITTDSRYLASGITSWLHNWKKRGWRKANGKPVLNQDLWRELDSLCQARKVHWHWTPAHAGQPQNERCDLLANQARLKLNQ